MEKQMIKQILFDFDGVIIDSMDVRDFGFRYIFRNYPEKLVEELIQYHRYNAGLSRYVKIRYFYEKLLGTSIDDDKINLLAEEFSKIMKDKLTDESILINETVEFIQSIYKTIPLHIVSGSDEIELNFLCNALGLKEYFVTIEGSPTPKNDLVSKIMKTYDYEPKETLLIGDSINDYEAAKKNHLYFVGFNNINLKKVSDVYADIIDKSILELDKGKYNAK
jgi:HAD superfamily hydrolase (TIGR01549 family)